MGLLEGRPLHGLYRRLSMNTLKARCHLTSCKIVSTKHCLETASTTLQSLTSSQADGGPVKGIDLRLDLLLEIIANVGQVVRVASVQPIFHIGSAAIEV